MYRCWIGLAIWKDCFWRPPTWASPLFPRDKLRCLNVSFHFQSWPVGSIWPNTLRAEASKGCISHHTRWRHARKLRPTGGARRWSYLPASWGCQRSALSFLKCSLSRSQYNEWWNLFQSILKFFLSSGMERSLYLSLTVIWLLRHICPSISCSFLVPLAHFFFYSFPFVNSAVSVWTSQQHCLLFLHIITSDWYPHYMRSTQALQTAQVGLSDANVCVCDVVQHKGTTFTRAFCICTFKTTYR